MNTLEELNISKNDIELLLQAHQILTDSIYQLRDTQQEIVYANDYCKGDTLVVGDYSLVPMIELIDVNLKEAVGYLENYSDCLIDKIKEIMNSQNMEEGSVIDE